ncbi:MAG TPA: recombinase family protein [Xanthobacteraceae bacterium]|jgi:DNA invertase Pin-like site-specific DNA recombinase|nr:recombinase family protein [Xanthobacteraceae bacterium]
MHSRLHRGELQRQEIGSLPAAQYLRQSDDHQKYSTENQSIANHAYAGRRGRIIVRTYCDAGISGLTFDKRDALKRLIEDVQTGRADFRTILVYDVSRWGRYQDPDEAAYYEFICKQAGVSVEYCAEPFENDGTPISAMFKSMKRAMAGEFSRELSVKVTAGQSRLIQLGFRVAGAPGYGLRRMLVDQFRKPKFVLNPGEQKNITTDRVILVPGPPDEIETVRWMYSAFVHERLGPRKIATLLNQRGVVNSSGNNWTGAQVRWLLRSEKYIGNSVWGRESVRLRQKRVSNSPDKWVRAEGVFEPIVDRALFVAAQAVDGSMLLSHRGRPRDISNDEMLKGLRDLLGEKGFLSSRLIDAAKIVPSTMTYCKRFGSLLAAYKAIGYKQTWTKRGLTSGGRPRGLTNEEMLGGLKFLRTERGYLTSEIIDSCKRLPCSNAYRRRFGNLSRPYGLIGFMPDPARTRALRTAEGRGASNEKLLDGLRDLLRRRGKLSGEIIDADKNIPCAQTYLNRFGRLMKAYELIGYKPDRCETRYGRPRGLSDKELLGGLRQLWRKHGVITEKIMSESTEVPSYVVYARRFGGLTEAYRRIGFDPKQHQHRGKRLQSAQTR